MALQDDASTLMVQPHPPYLSAHIPSSTESPRDSLVPETPRSERSESGMLITTKNEGAAVSMEDVPRKASRRRPLLIILMTCIVLILIAVAVVVPVYFTVIKPRNHGSSSTLASQSSSLTTGTPVPTTSSTSTGGTSTPPASTEAITGSDGSTIELANGTSFTYKNSFGGICESLFSNLVTVDTCLNASQGIPIPMILTITTHTRTHGLLHSIKPGILESIGLMG